MLDNNLKLGVNIDHVATLRQVRGTHYPDILAAAKLAEKGGADSITVHLREDRRHIQDEDVINLNTKIETRLNLELAANEEMKEFALNVRPSSCCIVPERREELTTEGGLDVLSNHGYLETFCRDLNSLGSFIKDCFTSISSIELSGLTNPLSSNILSYGISICLKLCKTKLFNFSCKRNRTKSSYYSCRQQSRFLYCL